jgi:hypothetical protein
LHNWIWQPFWILITNCAILNIDHKLCHFEYSLQIVPFWILITNCAILNIHYKLCHFEYCSQIVSFWIFITTSAILNIHHKSWQGPQIIQTIWQSLFPYDQEVSKKDIRFKTWPIEPMSWQMFTWSFEPWELKREFCL